MPPNDNPISRAVNSGIATAGNYAGGAVDAAGKSVSGAGRGVGKRYHPRPFFPYLPTTANNPPDYPSITNASNSAGGSASDYGNAVKDWTKASGPRTQTAKNPLGTSGGSYGGKKVVTGGGGGKGVAGGKETAGNPLGL